ncbi:MAG: glycoside hydrolase family 88 protein [bacterium]|nr:glycoside hydrolase family 88 protein [bacterium]
MYLYNLSDADRAWVDEVWNKIDSKLKVVAPLNKDKIPYTTVNGVYNDMASEDITWWTNGFWPGLMWLMYVGTKNDVYKEVAERSEELLDAAFGEYDTLHHDVGFMWHISSGVNYRLFGGKKSRVRTTIAADILASRYNAAGGFIRSWNDDCTGWVIIDSMMNIPILYWASEEYKDDRFKHIAVNHANKVLKTHIRPDGSVNHIVSLDPSNGEVVETFGGQGYGVGSSWTRGQAWAIYGFALSYLHTGNQEYLDAAKRVAHYFIANVCDDWLPKVDFRSPEEPIIYDATAGACTACGLLEIAKAVPENEKRLYLNAAIKLLKAMDENLCNWSLEEQSILQKGTEAYVCRPQGKEVPIIYGDYYFTEAIYKLKGFEMLFW